MTDLSISGLASGLDADTMIQKLLGAERRHQITSRTTGTANAFIASAAGLSEDAAKHVDPVDAQFTVDGVDRTSPTNLVADAIPGLDLTLSGATSGSPVTLNVSAPKPDPEAVKAKLRGFVEQYNNGGHRDLDRRRERQQRTEPRPHQPHADP
jgi:flagellar capping protein FliD